jgi:hypothetical protein
MYYFLFHIYFNLNLQCQIVISKLYFFYFIRKFLQNIEKKKTTTTKKD